MAFAATEGAEVGVFVFMRAWVPAVASKVPADANDSVVGAEEVMVTILGPYWLAIRFELDNGGAIGVLGCIMTSLSADKAVGRRGGGLATA